MSVRADRSTTPTIDPIIVAPDLMIRLDSDDALSLLAAGVPLSLMIDLALPTSSQEILAHEGGDAGWLRTHVA